MDIFLLILVVSGLVLAVLFWLWRVSSGPGDVLIQPVSPSPTGAPARPGQTVESLLSQPTGVVGPAGSEIAPITPPGQASEAAPVHSTPTPQAVEPNMGETTSSEPLTTTQPAQVSPEIIIVQPAGTRSWQEMEEASESEPPQQPTAIHIHPAPSVQAIDPNPD